MAILLCFCFFEKSPEEKSVVNVAQRIFILVEIGLKMKVKKTIDTLQDQVDGVR